MSCPCDPEVLRTLAAEAQPLLGQLFTGSIFFAVLLDPLTAVVILGFAAVLHSQESYLLSGWQLFAVGAVALLYLRAGYRRFKDLRDNRRIERDWQRHQEEDAYDKSSAYEAELERQQQSTEK